MVILLDFTALKLYLSGEGSEVVLTNCDLSIYSNEEDPVKLKDEDFRNFNFLIYCSYLL
jgi:hypothetical protein